MTLRRVAVLAATAVLTSACAAAPDPDADEEVGSAGSAMLTENALAMNALAMNALAMNALAMNALAMNALSPSSLAAVEDPGPDGALARQLLAYTVNCALDGSQSLSFTWTDEDLVVHAESYPGNIGLATGWATQPIGETAQRWVTACLASRVNWYEVSVSLSLRGKAAPLSKPSGAEVTDYAFREGAFWGNLYASPALVYACYYGPNVAHSRSKHRDCATGHLNADGTTSECGIIDVLGSCDVYCNRPASSGQYYPRCDSGLPDGDTDKVVTTYLQ